MKRLTVFMIAVLFGVAFSCQKDSLTGFNNEELDVRSEDAVFSKPHPKMVDFQANYILLQAEALPDEGFMREMKPPKGSTPILYGMRGSATFLGKFDQGMSYEIHFLPAEALEKPEGQLRVFVYGQFMGSKDLDCLKYFGQCIYYPDGRREYDYEFYSGTGPFSKVQGWIKGSGVAKAQGQFMEFTAKGKMTIPPLEN